MLRYIMETKIRNRALFIVAVVLVCVLALVWGSGLGGYPRNFDQVKQNFRNNIRLGLDLKGGTHLILQVHVEDAVKITRDQALDRLREELKAKKVPYADILPCADAASCADPQQRDKDTTHVFIRGVPQDKSADLQTVASEQFSDWEFSRVPGDTQARTLTLKVSAATTLRNQALEQAMNTIRNRVDQLGVVEPEIAEYGKAEDFELVVQLPGVDDPTRVKDIIQSTALLELKIVHDDRAYPSREAALAAHGGVLPPDAQLLPGRPQSSSESSAGQIWYIVDRIPAITGRDLTGAQPTQDSMGRAAVNFTLSRDGAVRFERITGQSVGRLLAIVLDNRVLDAPVIHSQIRDQGIIEGLSSQQYSTDLAVVLRSGALPASITYLSEETVGPSLGADSVRHGIVASIVGFVAIMVFMLLYYRGAGINADLALILNLLILVAALANLEVFAAVAIAVPLAWVLHPLAGIVTVGIGLVVALTSGSLAGATLTLPGIAGIILTVGMGVDSNVLIFERIREELRSGKAVPAAVSGGFDHAFKTIIDTHVTTVVSAAILFLFGTGPIKGFAVTLTMGLIANLFTSVFASRVIFDYILSKREKGGALSI